VANCLPLVGVLWWGWDTRTIVLLYWVENLVVGFYTILKMITLSTPEEAPIAAKLFMVPFFCVHYGMFCMVHGIFLVVMFGVGASGGLLSGGPGGPPDGSPIEMGKHLWRTMPAGFLWTALSLGVSHGVSFVQNYLLAGEYRRLPFGWVFFGPYPRMFVLHVAIIAGGITTVLIGSPMVLLLVIVVGKILLDLRLHTRTHRKARTNEPPPEET